MAIGTVNVGDFVYTSKLNELIAAVNELSVSAVNFNGQGTPAIRQATPDIISVTRIGPGAYRVNFATPRDRPYTPIVCCDVPPANDTGFETLISVAPGYFEMQTGTDNGPWPNDPAIVCAIIVG